MVRPDGKLALEAVRPVATQVSSGTQRRAFFQPVKSKTPCVLRGVMVNKDITHPAMRRRTNNSRIALLGPSALVQKGGKSNEHRVL